MTPEAQRIKTAELMGWEKCTECDQPGCCYWLPPNVVHWRYATTLPAYDTDANAALELCEAMAKDKWICRLFNDYGPDDGQNEWECVFFLGQRGTVGALEKDFIAPTLPLAILGAFLRCHGIDPNL